MKRQVWAFLGSIAAGAVTIAALVRAELLWALVSAFATVTFWLATRYWQSRSPIPFPYSFRWFLHVSRIAHTTKRLERILQPRMGERLLEVGPGIGTHALRVASAVAPGGLLVVLDVQREMLNGITRRAANGGITNIHPTNGDATHLPYADDVFDGAYLIGVLGEIPDQDAALRQLQRVVKPDGRLVIGEIFIDPDFSSLRVVRERVKQAGFLFCSKVGIGPAYLARFQRVTLPSESQDDRRNSCESSSALVHRSGPD